MKNLSIPGFKLLEALGEGGTCVVFKAKRLSDESFVAIKCLKPHHDRDVEVIARLRREAQLGRALVHENIVRTYSEGSVFDDHAQPPYWFAMELAEGEVLSDWIERRVVRLFSEAEICRFTIQVCQALAYAHGRKPPVVHRDIKPSNIAVPKVGQVKLMDFGIALEVGGERVTRPLTVIGTAEYMSPESVNTHRLDARSDLYSLGIVMYQLAVGQTPFVRAQGETDLAVLQKQAHYRPTAPRALRPELSEEFELIVLRLLRKEPAQRFQSASQLLEALEGHLARLEAAARQAPPADPERPVQPSAAPTPQPKSQPVPKKGPAKSRPVQQSTRTAAPEPPTRTLSRPKKRRRAGGRIAVSLVTLLALTLAGLGVVAAVRPEWLSGLKPAFDSLHDSLGSMLHSESDSQTGAIAEEVAVATEAPRPTNPNQLAKAAENLAWLLNASGSAAKGGNSKLDTQLALFAEQFEGIVADLVHPGEAGMRVEGANRADAISDDLANRLTMALLVRCQEELGSVKWPKPTPGGPTTRSVAGDAALSRVRSCYRAALALHAWRLTVSTGAGRRDDLNGFFSNAEKPLFEAAALALPLDGGGLLSMHASVIRLESDDCACVLLVPAFWLGQKEVRNQEYARFLDPKSTGDQMPKQSVSFEEAMAFASAFGLELPTYLMWHVVAFGDGDSSQIRMTAGKPSSVRFGEKKTTNAVLRPSDFKPVSDGEFCHVVEGGQDDQTRGFYHLFGNVAEWVRLDDLPEACRDCVLAHVMQGSRGNYYCGLSRYDNPENATKEWLGRDSSGRPGVGFRCALQLANAIELPARLVNKHRSHAQSAAASQPAPEDNEQDIKAAEPPSVGS